MRHEESKMQQACFKWFRLQFPDLALNIFAIGNGGYRRPHEARIMKAEGVTAGVADVQLVYANSQYHGLFIEFKTAKGRQQETQKHFQRAVEAQGYKYAIVRSIDDFIELIKDYVFRTPKN